MEAAVDVQVERGGRRAVGAGHGGHLHGGGAGEDVVGREGKIGHDGARGERRGQRIAREQPLVGGFDRHRIGFADREAARVPEAHQGIREFLQVVAGLGHGAVRRGGADFHPVEDGGLFEDVGRQAAAERRQMVGVGAGQPDVVRAELGGEGGEPVVVAHGVGAAGQVCQIGTQPARGRQSGQRGEGKLGVGKARFADAAAGAAVDVQIDRGDGKRGLRGGAAVRRQLGGGQVGGDEMERDEPVGGVPAFGRAERAFGAEVFVGGVLGQIAADAALVVAGRVPEAVEERGGDAFDVVDPRGEVLAEHDEIDLAFQILRGQMVVDGIAQSVAELDGRERGQVGGEADGADLVGGNAVLFGVVGTQFDGIRGVGVDDDEGAEGVGAAERRRRRPKAKNPK